MAITSYTCENCDCKDKIEALQLDLIICIDKIEATTIDKIEALQLELIICIDKIDATTGSNYMHR
jgi:hypothetical protein